MADTSGRPVASPPGNSPPGSPMPHSAVPRESPAPSAHRSALPAAELLALSHRGVGEAALATTAPRRYASAHLAALRAAAAVLACRTQPARSPRGPRPTSAWVLLAEVAPELGEWADFFALGARKRAAAEAGLQVVTAREADDLLRDAQSFLELVENLLDLDRRGTGRAPRGAVNRAPTGAVSSDVA